VQSFWVWQVLERNIMKTKSLIMLTIMAITSLNIWARDTYEASTSGDEGGAICSEGYKTFVNYASIFTEDLSFGLVNLIPQTLEDYCPGTDDKIAATNSRVDGLMTRVSELEKQMKDMGYNQNMLWAKLGQVVSDIYLTPYVAALKDFDNYVQEYKTAYPPYNSLLEFYKGNKANGDGFKKLYIPGSDFASKFTQTADLIQQLQKLMPLNPNAQKMENNLYATCWSAESIYGEVFETRRQCNMIVRDILLNIALRAAVAKKILNDEINTVNAALDSGDIDQQWIVGGGGMNNFRYTDEKSQNVFVNWKDALPVADQIVDKYSDDIKNILAGKNNEKLFRLRKDFPTQLDEFMTDNFCGWTNKSASGNYTFYPSVLEWYPNGNKDNKPTSVVEPPYIVTNCMARSKPEERVKAKYYLAGGNGVYNWMGVLVPVPSIANKITAKQPISITPNKTRSFTYADFYLNSGLPLRVNSTSIKSYYEEGKMYAGYLPTFMQVDRYEPIDPVYSYNNGGVYSIKGLTGESQPSSFLQPVTLENGSKSNVKFVSKIWNINSATLISPEKTADGSQLNATVFLSFERNNFTYVFGLEVFNIGAKSERIRSPEGSYSVDIDPKQTVSLSCVADTQCTVSGNEIIWKDGTYASISGGGSNISLSFGKK